MKRFINKVFTGDALALMRVIPSESVNAIITDPMFGVQSRFSTYEWGPDPSKGDPIRHWNYHGPIYSECRRVLKAGGILAWAVGLRHFSHFKKWFGNHRIWTLSRVGLHRSAPGQMWVVQTREQKPIRFPDKNGIIFYKSVDPLRKLHPCPKPTEEMAFLVESLTQPNHIVLDCFSGLGSTLVAAQMLGRRWIGCDISRFYCQVALHRLDTLRQQGVA
jgi:DNA modification methylase